MTKQFTVDDAIRQLQEISAAGFGLAPLLLHHELSYNFDFLADCQGFVLHVLSENSNYPFVKVE